MKKILLATTAVIATAGMAAAEVTFGGLGRFGVHYNESRAEDNVNLASRLRLQIDTSAQTDAGIELGGRLRAQYDHKNGATDQAKWSGGRLHAAMGPVTLYVGNVGDAVDAMPGLYLPTTSASTGLTYHNDGLVAYGVGGFSSNGPGVVNGVSLAYSMGDVGLQVNSSDDHTNRKISAHIHYTIGGWQIAIGGLDAEDEKNIVAGTVTGDLGFAKVGAAFGRNENVDENVDADKFRVFGEIPIGMATELVLWGADEDKSTKGDGGSFGVNVEHSLGGGVTAVAGYGEDASDDSAQASAGIFFKF